MAIIRKSDLKKMAESDVKAKLSELLKERMVESAKISSGGTPDNPGKMKEMRRTIARLKTLAKEKAYRIE